MAKQIELETVLRGEEARAFNEYVNAPVQTFTSESRALFREARKLSEATYKIKKPGAWVRFRYWLHGKLT